MAPLSLGFSRQFGADKFPLQLLSLCAQGADTLQRMILRETTDILQVELRLDAGI